MVRRPSRLEQALVPRTVAGRGLKVDRVAWEGESGNRGAVRGREEAETKVSNSASGNLGGAGALLWDLSGTEAVGERPQRSLLFRSLFPLQQRSLTLSPVLAKIVSLDL